MILCDLFPLYQFPTDVCSPTKKLIEREEDVQPGNTSTSVLNQIFVGKKNKKSASYGLERHERPSTTELVLIVWVFTLFFEEIRQVFSIVHNLDARIDILVFYCQNTIQTKSVDRLFSSLLESIRCSRNSFVFHWTRTSIFAIGRLLLCGTYCPSD